MLFVKISFCLFASPLMALSLILMGSIIWFYKSRTPGETLPYFAVGTDSLSIHMLGLFLTYAGFMIAIFFGPVQVPYLAGSFAFCHYIVLCCIVSSEIVHFALKFAYVYQPAAILEARDSLMRKAAWAARLILTCLIVCLDFVDPKKTETFITQALKSESDEKA